MRRFLRLALVVAATLFGVWIDLLATSFVTRPSDALPLAGEFAFGRGPWVIPVELRRLQTGETWTPDESPVGVRPDFAH